MTNKDIYASKIFLYSVLPLLKVIKNDDKKIAKSFQGKKGILQVSAKDSESKVGIHFILGEQEWEVVKGVHDHPTVELEFQSIPSLNAFFAGKSKKLPRIRGGRHLGLLISFFKVLLKLSSLLGAKEAPKDEKEQFLLVKLYFYLIPSGISQLNRVGHPAISKWVKKSPDRVYAWAVDGQEELNAYIRIKAGKSKAARGIYRRAKPFFTMRFDSIESALGILLQQEDMLAFTAEGKLMMEGAPEFGAKIGEFMMLIGEYAGG